MMINAHARLKLVVDHNNVFLGIISLDDLSEQEIMEKAAVGYDRSCLMVTDLMKPKQSLRVFDYSELAFASIRDVINKMGNFGQPYCLVADRSRHHIRGIISASEIT